MIDPIELEHSRYQIARAEARLAYQNTLVSGLPRNEDSRSMTRENEVLLELQDRLAGALARHAHLIEELRFRTLIYGNLSEKPNP